MNVKQKVELLQEHEHEGRTHPAGAVLDVDADTARWLIEQGVAKAVTTERKTATGASLHRGPHIDPINEPKPKQED